MARISGVDIPKQKRGVIALTYIYGIGRSRAQEILAISKVSEDTKVSDWTDEETGRIREAVGSFKIEGEIKSNIKDNEYYDRIHKELSKKYGVEELTAAQMGGLECGKCHY